MTPDATLGATARVLHSMTPSSRRHRVLRLPRRRPLAAAIGLGLVGVLALLVAACGGGGEPTLATLDLADVATTTARRGPAEVTVEEVGVLRAARQIPVKAPFGGQVAWIAEDGIEVREGDVVVRLEVEKLVEDVERRINELKLTRADIEKNIEQLEQKMRSQTLDVESAMAGLEFDRTRLIDLNRTLETLETLAALALVPRTEVDTAARQWESRKLETYKSDLSFQRSSETSRADQTIQSSRLSDLALRGRRGLLRVEELQGRLDESTQRAPGSGTWMIARTWNWQAGGERPVTIGQQVHGGHVLGTVAISESFGVMSQVSESRIAQVAVGARAWISSQTLGGERLPAHVARIGFAAIPREMSPGGAKNSVTDFSGLKVFEVELELDEAPDVLKNGMTVDVSIVIEDIPDAVTIPPDALHRSEGMPVVFVRTPAGAAERRVVPGPASRDRVIIREGLDGGETLFLADLNEKLRRELAARRPRTAAN